MTSVDLERLVTELAIEWRSPPRTESHEDYAEIEGAVMATPSSEAIERAVRALRLEAKRIPRRAVGDRAPVVEMVARHDAEELRIVSVPAAASPHAAVATLRLTWKSGRRPAITGTTYAWNERTWPLVLDDAVVYHRSSRMLVLEGHAPPDAAARLAAWADANGMRAPAPPYEPDLAGAFHARDGAFALTLTSRGEWTTLTIERVEDER